MPKARYLDPQLFQGNGWCRFLFLCFFSTSLILLKLNGCQILELDVLKVGTFNFAVLMAISNPLVYCLKYGGSLIWGEKALQAGCSAIKVSGGLHGCGQDIYVKVKYHTSNDFHHQYTHIP